MPAAVITEKGHTGEAVVIQEEARHRMREGKRIRVFAHEAAAQAARVGGDDADERPVAAVAARRRDLRAELVQPPEEPIGEPPDVGLDRRDPRLLDERHAGEAGVDVGDRRRPGVEAARADALAAGLGV